MPGLQSFQLRDAVLNRVSEAFDFCRRIAGGAKSVANLIAREPREYIADPASVFARDVLADPGEMNLLHILVRRGQEDERIAVRRVEVD